MPVPAEKLKGLTLAGGWYVEDSLAPPIGATGGNFSYGYRVKNKDGRLGFLKALDFSRALLHADPVSALKPLIDAFDFERSLLAKCKTERMDKIVVALEDGSVMVDPHSHIGMVQYLILEHADGDIRAHLNLLGKVEVAWKLRSLHHIATGLHQLHGKNVAHQDVKPSNVLVFSNSVSKIGDLGCASQKGTGGPRDQRPYAGDPAYAPIEALYGYFDPEWSYRRQGCDLWHLGSMAVFLFAGTTMNSLLIDEIPVAMRPNVFTGTFISVLPYVTNAFDKAIEALASNVADEKLRKELKLMVRQLCNPDPKLRGHPTNRQYGTNPMSLERYVSGFNLLAERAEIGIYGK